MMLLDTSALYALADRADRHHRTAKELFGKARRAGEEFWVHSYILVETVALIHHRLGFASAEKFLRDAVNFQIIWVDASVHEAGADFFLKRRKQNVSFVDCVSFAVMQQRGIEVVFAFDDDFTKAGFKLYS